MPTLSKTKTTSSATPHIKYGETEVFYNALLYGLSDLAIYMLDPRGNILTWNKGAKVIKQYESNEVIGKNFSMFYTTPDLDKHLPEYELDYAKINGKFEGTGWRVRKNGTQIWVEVVISPLKDKKNKLLGFIKVVRDATEKKKALDLIEQQKRDIADLTTPILKLWENILVLPIIGTLDSSRSEIMIQRLLKTIIAAECLVTIIDISDVPIVDSTVTQHLFKAIGAAKLMGTKCIITGIRPEIAQTMVNLGLDLSKLSTKSNLSMALEEALNYLNMEISIKAD